MALDKALEDLEKRRAEFEKDRSQNVQANKLELDALEMKSLSQTVEIERLKEERDQLMVLVQHEKEEASKILQLNKTLQNKLAGSYHKSSDLVKVEKERDVFKAQADKLQQYMKTAIYGILVFIIIIAFLFPKRH